MKALFVGLGSIGQRHLRNLKTLIRDIEILAYRKSRNVPFLNNKNNPCENIDLKKFYKIKEFICFKKALEEKPDIGIYYKSIKISFIFCNRGYESRIFCIYRKTFIFRF